MRSTAPLPGEADTPELPAGSPGKADTPEVPEPAADQPKDDIDARIRRLGRPAGVSSASEPAADQPKDDIDARLARMGREVEIFVQRGGWSGLAKNRAQRR